MTSAVARPMMLVAAAAHSRRSCRVPRLHAAAWTEGSPWAWPWGSPLGLPGPLEPLGCVPCSQPCSRPSRLPPRAACAACARAPPPLPQAPLPRPPQPRPPRCLSRELRWAQELRLASDHPPCDTAPQEHQHPRRRPWPWPQPGLGRCGRTCSRRERGAIRCYSAELCCVRAGCGQGAGREQAGCGQGAGRCAGADGVRWCGRLGC